MSFASADRDDPLRRLDQTARLAKQHDAHQSTFKKEHLWTAFRSL
jgi:hypothetical protein